MTRCSRHFVHSIWIASLVSKHYSFWRGSSRSCEPWRARRRRNMFVLVMVVTASGNSTIGALLAARLGLAFHDADDYHPPENLAKLAAGIALGGADRWPWLARLSELSESWEGEGGAVLACSALRQAYRDVLLQRVHSPRVVY